MHLNEKELAYLEQEVLNHADQIFKEEAKDRWTHTVLELIQSSLGYRVGVDHVYVSKEEKDHILENADNIIDELIKERDELESKEHNEYRGFNIGKRYGKSVAYYKAIKYLCGQDKVDFALAERIENTFIIWDRNRPDKKFIYHSSTGKWRGNGRPKYYRSKSLEDFIERYVLTRGKYERN